MVTKQLFLGIWLMSIIGALSVIPLQAVVENHDSSGMSENFDYICKQVKLGIHKCQVWMAAHKKDVKFFRLFFPFICLYQSIRLNMKGKSVVWCDLLTMGFCGWNFCDYFFSGLVIEDTVSLPSVLNNLKNYKVKHIKSKQQQEGSCGWHAVFNAVAIQELLTKKQKLHAQDIEKIAWDMLAAVEHTDIKKKELDVKNILGSLFLSEEDKIATKLGLNNYYLISFKGDDLFTCMAGQKSGELEKQCLFYGKQDDGYYCYTMPMKSLQNVIKYNKIDTVDVAHILLSTPCDMTNSGHGVLLSIIKWPNKKPLIIYMDSNNRKLSQCKLDYAVPYFVCKFIKSLDVHLVAQ